MTSQPPIAAGLVSVPFRCTPIGVVASIRAPRGANLRHHDLAPDVFLVSIPRPREGVAIQQFVAILGPERQRLQPFGARRFSANG
jgi:hypothetical protein